MISRLGQRLSGYSERFVPDPFVLAIALSAFVAVVAIASGSAVAALPLLERIKVVADGWYQQVWSGGLMKFAMQMCIVLVTGHALATSKPVQRVIHLLATHVHSARAAAAVVALIACLASLIQWGLGAIVGALFAREVGRAFRSAGKAVHYPLLGAAGYAGFLVWHGGLSGSAPLKVAEDGHFLEATIGVIPITETLLSPLNLVVTGTLLVLIPTVFFFLSPVDASEMQPYPRDDGDEAAEVDTGPRAVSLLASMVVGTYLVYHFVTHGWAGWNLDSVNLGFFALGLACHSGPNSYMRAATDGVKGCAGIIVQFPIYFGVLGMLESSGLIIDVSHAFTSIATSATYPTLTFLSAGVVNFFVPSGGGQWAVQGPVMMEGVAALGVAPAKVVMALAYGDAWTNMLQPFWALPLLGIMRLQARDILGYTALIFCVSGPLIIGLLLVL